MFNQKGFTIKELLMVFVVIAILCLAAIPPFFALQSRRKTEMKKKTIESQTPTPAADGLLRRHPFYQFSQNRIAWIG